MFYYKMIRTVVFSML